MNIFKCKEMVPGPMGIDRPMDVRDTAQMVRQTPTDNDRGMAQLPGQQNLSVGVESVMRPRRGRGY